jgi:hypothetical protein
VHLVKRAKKKSLPREALTETDSDAKYPPSADRLMRPNRSP